MCRQVTCRKCGQPTWAGCGQHVDQVMAGVPKARNAARATPRNPAPAFSPSSSGAVNSSQPAPAPEVAGTIPPASPGTCSRGIPRRLEMSQPGRTSMNLGPRRAVLG